MIMAISACPMTVAQILDLADQDRARTSSRSTTSSTASWTSTRQLDAIEDVDDDDVEDDEDEDEGDAGAIAAENLERLKVAALERFSDDPQATTRACSPCCRRKATRRRSTSSCRRRSARADADPLLRAPGREAVRQRALRGRQHPPDRAQDPGPRRQQGRHAASGFHQEVPGERDLAALDRPRGRRAPQLQRAARASTGRRSSSSSRSSSTCRRA